MNGFIRLTELTGDTALVNPDNINFVGVDAHKKTQVYFCDGDPTPLRVKESLDDIADKIGEARGLE